MAGGVRFRSIDDMPPGARAAAQAALARQRQSSKTKVRPRKHKYGATPTVVDGIRFDSKREARCYESLKARQQAGEVAFFLRQVPIHLPGGTKLVIDFLVFFTDGRQPEFMDAKGHETAVFKVKRREVEAAYPIQIITV
jgi:hypothetical protein